MAKYELMFVLVTYFDHTDLPSSLGHSYWGTLQWQSRTWVPRYRYTAVRNAGRKYRHHNALHSSHPDILLYTNTLQSVEDNNKSFNHLPVRDSYIVQRIETRMCQVYVLIY